MKTAIFVQRVKKLNFSYINESKNYSKIYASSQKVCTVCELKTKCIIGKTQKSRKIHRPFYQELAEKSYESIGTEKYNLMQKLRCSWC